MASIETVTGAIDAERARHDADPRAPANPRRGGPRPVAAGQGLGRDPAEARAARRRLREAAIEAAEAARRARDQDDLRPDRDVPRPRRRLHARGLRGDRAAGRPLHRDLHLRPPAAVLRQPRPRPDRRPLRRRHRAGDPGDRDQGRVHQVRRRRARRDRERREGPPRRRPRRACAPARRSWPTPAPPATPRPRQIEIFLEEGVDLAKVQIAHSGDTDDLDYIERLLEKGVWIGLDRYGLEMYLPYEQRQATALALLERGYAERLFLSADSCATIDWFPPEVGRAAARGGDGQGLDDPDRPRAGDPGPSRGRRVARSRSRR